MIGNVPVVRLSYTDDFGCVWKTAMDGIVGTVVEHPLADWANWESYRGPDPSRVMGIGPIDWEVEAISTPQGGLCMTYGLYPGVLLENVRALMDAMERYMCYWS